jgi:hypothetical protein
MERNVCLLLINTESERKYQIGRAYKFEPLKYGECIINEKWRSSLNVNEGDLIYMRIKVLNLMNALINRFNTEYN